MSIIFLVYAMTLCCYSIMYLKERMSAKVFTIYKASSFWKQWLSLMVVPGMCGEMDSCTFASWS